MEILTGPKGGKYYIDEKGRKRYLKRESSEMAQNSGRKRANETQKSKSQKVSETVYRKHTVTVSDYEHSSNPKKSRVSQTIRYKDPSIISEGDKSKHYCCCCGKELSISDINYYDLTNYCPKCALADGIITSLE